MWQTRYLISQQCIKPLCDALAEQDVNDIREGALKAISSILSTSAAQPGEAEMGHAYAVLIEGAGGMDKLKARVSHADAKIAGQAQQALDRLSVALA